MQALSIIISIIILGVIIKSILIFMSKREKNIEINGIEVEATVTKVTRGNGYYNSYVTYIGDDNNEHEAVIINISKNFPYGKKLRIKFLPGKYKNCIVVLD